MVDKPLPNHIEEYMNNNFQKSEFTDLFEAEKENIDLRSDFSIQEIVLLDILHIDAQYLEDLGLKNNFYSRFLNIYERLKVSKDRQSRKEFVDINKKERFENNLEKFNQFGQLKDVKK